jgi:hypothetical protein
MAGKAKAAGIAFVVAAVTLLLVPSAYAQSKKGSHAAPTTETKPRVDEKAYKAALDRIPTPKKPYDPWDQVHSSEQPKPSGKTN